MLTLIPSSKCEAFVTAIEGNKLRSYDDLGSLAIGRGHSNRSGLPPVVYAGMTISAVQSDQILIQDLTVYAYSLFLKIGPKVFGWLSQGMWDALVAEAMNLGTNGLLKAVGDPLRLGDWNEVHSAIRFNLPPRDSKIWLGIARRREAAARLFAGRPDFLDALKLTAEALDARLR